MPPPTMQNIVPMIVQGHCVITDDEGTVLVDKSNAIHPQNMARIFARALANEPQSSIFRMAFGDGGTTVDASFAVQYKKPNDGQLPDTETWGSRIYNEVYSEIVDDSNINIGFDPGSADINTGVRSGGGSSPENDPPSIEHVSGPGVRSNDLGLLSEVQIMCVLNAQEPRSQLTSDTSSGVGVDFIFDEIGLYTQGAPAINTSGYQQIVIGSTSASSKSSSDVTSLGPGVTYQFNIAVDGGAQQTIAFTTPVGGGSGALGQFLYGDVCQALNTNDPNWAITPTAPNAIFSITDTSDGAFSTIAGAQTYGYLVVQSKIAGVGNGTTPPSTIDLSGIQTAAFISQLGAPSPGALLPAVAGVNAGVANNPTTPSIQRERLLAHLIFSPQRKTANRSLTIRYTLTISVARTATVG